MTEYDAGTSASKCYSNMENYGSHGRWRPIVPPTPVSIVPNLFNILRPHNMPASGLRPSNDHSRQQCGGYKTLDGTCRKCWTK